MSPDFSGPVRASPLGVSSIWRVAALSLSPSRSMAEATSGAVRRAGLSRASVRMARSVAVRGRRRMVAPSTSR